MRHWLMLRQTGLDARREIEREQVDLMPRVGRYFDGLIVKGRSWQEDRGVVKAACLDLVSAALAEDMLVCWMRDLWPTFLSGTQELYDPKTALLSSVFYATAIQTVNIEATRFRGIVTSGLDCEPYSADPPFDKLEGFGPDVRHAVLAAIGEARRAAGEVGVVHPGVGRFSEAYYGWYLRYLGREAIAGITRRLRAADELMFRSNAVPAGHRIELPWWMVEIGVSGEGRPLSPAEYFAFDWPAVLAAWPMVHNVCVLVYPGDLQWLLIGAEQIRGTDTRHAVAAAQEDLSVYDRRDSGDVG